MWQSQQEAPSKDLGVRPGDGDGGVGGGVMDMLLPLPFRGDPTVDDAFVTIMQWLYSKIVSTR